MVIEPVPLALTKCFPSGCTSCVDKTADHHHVHH